jgi:PPOX class probable F420-dependent enzyme
MECPVELPPAALRHIEHDLVAWLTTVDKSGTPVPTPVWFIPEGEDLVVFSQPGSKKIANIGRHPRVTLHFNCDADGYDLAVLTGDATVEPDQRPSEQPGYVDKYRESLRRLDAKPEQFDGAYSVKLRIRPVRVWPKGGPLAS